MLLAAVAAVPALSARSACAAAAGHAGVAIRYSDTREETHCAAMKGASASGIEALRASGVPVVIKQDPNFGAFVCKIGDVGVEFDKCPSKEGYWAYWHFLDGNWRFATTGAADYKVACGAVDGWVWAKGEEVGSPPSEAAGFAGICKGRPCSSAAAKTKAPSAPAEGTPAAVRYLIAAAIGAVAGGSIIFGIWRLRSSNS